MIGPNCMGLTDHSTGLQAVAYLDVPPGAIGFISQSGAMGEEIVVRARAWGCGFSRYVTLGNQADVGIAEVLAGFADHEATRVVAVYAEELRDGRPFAAAAARVVAAGKPVVLLAPGRSAAGARAARSHTGSLAPDRWSLDAVCRAAGIVRAETPRELFELTAGLRDAPAAARDAGWRSSPRAAATAASPPTPSARPVSRVPRVQRRSGRARARGAARRAPATNPIDFAIGTTEPDTYASRAARAGRRRTRSTPSSRWASSATGRRASPSSTSWSPPRWRARRPCPRAARSAGMPLVVSTVYAESAPAARLRAAGIPVYREIASAADLLAALARVAEAVACGSARSCPPPGAAGRRARLLGGARGPRRRRADASLRPSG